MNGINTMMGMLALMMPEEAVVEQLEEAIAEYKVNGDFDKLVPSCYLVVLKSVIGDNPDKLLGMQQDLGNVEKALKIVKPDMSGN